WWLRVLDRLVRPLLACLLGGPPTTWDATAQLGGAAWKPNSRLQAAPARLLLTRDGARAELAAASPSGDPFGLLAADCYALLPPNARPGETAAVPGARSP